MKTTLLSAASLAALTLPYAAFGQAAPVNPTSSPSAGAPAGTAPAAAPQGLASADTSGIQEIIVTAQRREQSVQRSSLAIDVVTGSELVKAGVSRTEDLTRLVPGLQLAQVGTTAQPFIRGVGNASNTGTNDSGVAFNVDGVYIGQPVAYGLDFYDLARIEVLKGPQGTLYGRNATGGAINLITNAPGDKFGGYVTVEYGNYDNKRITGAVDVPLAEDLSIRAAGNVVDRDGYYKDGSGDDVQQAGRLRLKYSPERLNLLVNVEYGHVGGVGGGSAVIDGNLDGNPANGLEYNLVNTWLGMGSPQNLARYNVARDKTQRQFNNVKAFMASSQADIDLGSDITLTLLPAYRRVTQRSSGYAAGFLYQPRFIGFRQGSMEVRLAQNTDRWKWVVGGFYYRQNIDSQFYVDQQILPPGILPPGLGTGIRLLVEPDQKTRSYSFFGETTFSLTDTLRLIGGARYTHDKNTGMGRQTFFEKPASPCSVAAPCPSTYSAGITSNNVSWKGGVEYDLAERSLLFFTASTGFKAGGTFPATAPRNVFKPEKLLAFELGSRNRFLDNKLQVNVEAFYWDYKNKQETIAGFDSCGGPVCAPPLQGGALTNLTINSGKARIYGGSADVLFRATDNDTLHGAVEYANSKYTDFTYSVPSRPNTGCSQTPPSGGNPLFTVNCNGFPLTRSPKWTATADYQHIFPLANNGDITFGAAATYTSSRYLDAHLLQSTKAPDYAIFSADLTYNHPGGRFSLTAYGKNLGNKAAAITGYSLADTALQPFTTAAVLAPPRTYGVRGTFKF